MEFTARYCPTNSEGEKEGGFGIEEKTSKGSRKRRDSPDKNLATVTESWTFVKKKNAIVLCVDVNQMRGGGEQLRTDAA